MEVMTEKGTERLVELLKQDITDTEALITQLSNIETTVKTRYIQEGNELNERTILAYPTIAEYSREDIKGMYWENGTWNSCTILTGQMGTWATGWSPLNIKACGPLYNNSFVQCLKQDGSQLNCYAKWMRTAALDLDTSGQGMYIWQGYFDMVAEEGPRIISTPNNLIRLCITGVKTLEVKPWS